MRTYALPGFVVLTITVSAILAAAAAQPRQLAATDAQLKEAPLTISVSTVGRFSSGSSWHLSVNSAGQAELTIDTFPDRTHKRFQVSQEQLAEFRNALTAERFFELSGEYGQKVPDGSESTLTVTAGRHANTVRVYFLMNWVAADKAKLREPSRAVRLLVLVRGWFDFKEAVDLRPFDRRVLDAAEESPPNPSL
jgi:hypothetical protein